MGSVVRILGFGFGVWGFGFRVSGFGFRVQGFGFRVSGFGFRVQAYGQGWFCRMKVRVIHLGRYTFQAISGRGDQRTRIPDFEGVPRLGVEVRREVRVYSFI